jgi:hypothetical protein
VGEIDGRRATIEPDESGALSGRIGEVTDDLARRVDPHGEGLPGRRDIHIDVLVGRYSESVPSVAAIEIRPDDKTGTVDCARQGLLAVRGARNINAGKAAARIDETVPVIVGIAAVEQTARFRPGYTRRPSDGIAPDD